MNHSPIPVWPARAGLIAIAAIPLAIFVAFILGAPMAGVYIMVFVGLPAFIASIIFAKTGLSEKKRKGSAPGYGWAFAAVLVGLCFWGFLLWNALAGSPIL